MKMHLSKMSLWQSLLSLVALVIFMFLAGSSGTLELLSEIMKYSNEPLGNGYYRETDVAVDFDHNFESIKTTTGIRGEHYGKWQGKVTIKNESNKGRIIGDSTVEVVIMKDGKRDGQSIISKYRKGKLYEVEKPCYSMGERIDCNKSEHIKMDELSAFQVLSHQYPWFLCTLNSLGFNDEYMEAYMDTLETVLATYEFEVIDFDRYYEYAIADLEKTAYDSLITRYLAIRIFQGMEELRNAELRMAVIDHYRSDGKTTYEMVETTYPGYLLTLNKAGVNDRDFEGFCHVLDSCMASYGILDPEDDLFIDSVDARMFRAMEYIYETGGSSLKSMPYMESTALFSNHKDFRSIYKKVHSILKQLFLKSSPSDVVEVVLDFMAEQFDQGDIIKRAVRKAYFDNKGVISVPTVTTSFSIHNSATSVDLSGYVIEDGGASVTSRGIAWAIFYNPTTNDNIEPSGTGTGSFAVPLDGLIEGTTYYARTYATNSAGTAYGNCIYFMAGSTVGTDDFKAFDGDINIYPNPASTSSTLILQLESPTNLVLTVMDMKGLAVYQHDLGLLLPGENQIELDLTGFPPGLYRCRLSEKGATKATAKLLIAR
jgi:hypothetical protein